MQGLLLGYHGSGLSEHNLGKVIQDILPPKAELQNLLDCLERLILEVYDEAAPSQVLGITELVKCLRSYCKFDLLIKAYYTRGEGFIRRKRV